MLFYSNTISDRQTTQFELYIVAILFVVLCISTDTMFASFDKYTHTGNTIVFFLHFKLKIVNQCIFNKTKHVGLLNTCILYNVLYIIKQKKEKDTLGNLKWNACCTGYVENIYDKKNNGTCIMIKICFIVFLYVHVCIKVLVLIRHCYHYWIWLQT